MASAAIKNAVESKDIVRIRDALRISLTLDHNYQSGMFPEDREYCRERGWDANLYEPHDGRDLLADMDTEESFDTLLGHLSTNFSKERLERLLALGKKLWPQEPESGTASPTEAVSPPAGAAGTRREGGERILGERPVNVSGTSHGTGSGRVVNERILEEREIPRDGSGTGGDGRYGPSSTRRSDSEGSSNFMVAAAVVVVAVVAVAVVVAIIIKWKKAL